MHRLLAIAALVAGVLGVAAVACSAFETAASTAADGGTLDAESAAGVAAIACFDCAGESDCVAYGPAAFCAADGGIFDLSLEKGNPPPTCDGDAYVLESPSTLDAKLSARFEVDQIPSVRIGLRLAARGRGVIATVGPLSLELRDGAASTTDLTGCRGDSCKTLLSMPDGDLTFHDIVFTARFLTGPDGGAATRWTTQVDCVEVSDIGIVDRPSTIEVAFGPINTGDATTVKVAALRVVRPRSR